jgi:hypothetical protein
MLIWQESIEDCLPLTTGRQAGGLKVIQFPESIRYKLAIIRQTRHVIDNTACGT